MEPNEEKPVEVVAPVKRPIARLYAKIIHPDGTEEDLGLIASSEGVKKDG